MKGPVQKLENSHWGALTVQTVDDLSIKINSDVIKTNKWERRKLLPYSRVPADEWGRNNEVERKT